MKFLGMDKVVCLSPHPDDVEYSLSGTVLKYYETKYKIKLQPNQIEEAKKHRKTILQALPILDFLNSLETIE